MKVMEFGPLLTTDMNLAQVMQIATNVASSKATVLISGESGTGKELLAKYIHQKSPRNSRRFVAINCAALPEGLLESELFGYERGAFTGAIAQKIGKFELASGSTLLLDEISEMPLALQSKLLRVLQEEEVDRLGGRTPVPVNLRIIATTNRNLKEAVREGLFREDLFYRINVIPLFIPSLRERPGDIVLLAKHFVQVSGILNQKSGVQLSPEALEKIKSWSWPGNVRELENVMERAVLTTTKSVIDCENIVLDDRGLTTTLPEAAGTTIAEMERRLIYKTLQETGQNRTRAAQILGISIRTLRNKLHIYERSENG